ncbi:MAG TPA: hypothetical protein VK187_08830 [Geobacteraceae bacterium]|nr:hypothetical protein [Geobacteraceae bacterium]
MAQSIKEISLSNGLTVTFFNHTRQYFGDFHLVKMEIKCKVPVLSRYFADQEAWAEARSLLGEEIVYRRMAEQMGVPSIEICTVLDGLMVNFLENSLPYFSSALFPERMLLAEINKIKKKKVRTRYP